VEVEPVEEGYKLGEAILHFFASAELVLVVEIGLVYDAFEVVGLGKLADDFVKCKQNECSACMEGHRIIYSAQPQPCPDYFQAVSGLLHRLCQSACRYTR
jgi:hypothetical protein